MSGQTAGPNWLKFGGHVEQEQGSDIGWVPLAFKAIFEAKKVILKAVMDRRPVLGLVIDYKSKYS